MSGKSAKKAKTLSVPREMPEIQKAYGKLVSDAGQVQYQISVYTEQLTQLNAQLRAVNNEAAARQQLDAQKPKPESKPEQAQPETAQEQAV